MNTAFQNLFSTLFMSVILVATGALGLQKYNEDKQAGASKNFMIFAIVWGVIGIVLSVLGGAFLKYKK